MALTDRPTTRNDAPSPTRPSAPRGEPPYNWRATGLLVLGILLLVGVMAIAMELTRTPTSPAGAPAPSPTTAAEAVGMTQPRPTAASAFTPQSPASQPLVAPTRVPTPAPMSARGSQSTAAPTQASTGQSTSLSTPQSSAQPAAVAPTPVTAGEPQWYPTPAGPTIGASPIDPALLEEIARAYSSYWNVRARSMAQPDPAWPELMNVMADQELARAQTFLQKLQEQGRIVDTHTQHDVRVVWASGDQAELFDRLTDQSVYLDVTTKQPITDQQQPDEVPGTYLMRKIDGVWKVVDEVS